MILKINICIKGGIIINNILSYNTQIASYLLWEKTKNSSNCSALSSWYCCEDIAFYFKENKIISLIKLKEISNKEKSNIDYINFIRNISYRIYIFTNNNNSKYNWYIAESLLENYEWCRTMVNIAYIYNEIMKSNIKVTVRNENIKHKLDKNN